MLYFQVVNVFSGAHVFLIVEVLFYKAQNYPGFASIHVASVKSLLKM